MAPGKIRILAVLTVLALGSSAGAEDVAHDGAPTPAQALQWLEEGNVRFQAGAAEGPRRDEARRMDTFTGGQHPYAAVLSCADSRVPPEILFDSGIGDLFVVRVAGNVADVDEIGTLEYGVEHLHTPLVVVLGHSRCGAVTAVIEGAHVSPNIEKLVDNIVPAAESTRARFSSLKGAALVQQTIRMNVRQAIADMLAHSQIIREHVSAGKVKVVGAVYDINSGAIEWMGPHPNEAALLADQKDAPVAVDGHGGDGHGGEMLSPHVANAPVTHETTAPAHEQTEKNPDAHGVPAEHEPEADHGELHDKSHEQTPATQPGHDAHSNGARPHNFLALGGCLAGGAVMSVLTIHFTRKAPAKANIEKAKL